MRTVEVLVAARALITKESKYDMNGDLRTPGRVIGTVYKTAKGKDTLKLSEASCFCSLGAVNAAVGADAESHTCGLFRLEEDDSFYRHAGITKPTEAQRKAYKNATKYLRQAFRIITGNADIAGVNDDTHLDNHKRVLQCFDLAIKNAKRRHINGKRYASQASVIF